MMNINTNDYLPTSLDDLGRNSFSQKYYQTVKIPGSVPARVISESKGSFQVYCQSGVLFAKISGKMRYRTWEEKQYPAVGDWVVVKPLINEQKGIIHAVLPRKSEFSRKVADERTEEQIVSANVDTVFIVSSLDGGRNFNIRRIERYFTLA
jgi:ribosome biogenesis GTPase